MNPVPIYRSDGEWVALLQRGHLYDTVGDWIGWVEHDGVHSRDGYYVGYLSKDRRILCQRISPQRARKTPPPAPAPVQVPARVPLAPLFAELPWGEVDVFEENPQVFYISELKPDWEG